MRLLVNVSYARGLMKKMSKIRIYKLPYIILFIISIFALFISAQAIFIAYINNHQTKIIKELSQKINSPFFIDKIAAHWHGISTQITLTDVIIYNKTKTKKTKINKIQIYVDSLSSILALKLKFNKISLDQADIVLKNFSLQNSNVKNIINIKKYCSTIDWLEDKSLILANNINIKIITLQKKSFFININKLHLTNFTRKHKIFAHITIENNGIKSSNNIFITIRGNLADYPNISINGEVNLNNFDATLLNLIPNNQLTRKIKSATINAKLKLILSKNNKKLFTNIAINNLIIANAAQKKLYIKKLSANASYIANKNHWQIDADNISLQSKNYNCIKCAFYLKKKYALDYGIINIIGKNIYSAKNNIFNKKISIKYLSGYATWQQKNDKFHINIRKLHAKNSAINLYINGVLDIPNDYAHTFADFKSNVTISNLNTLTKYLPLKIMPHDFASWIDGAFINSDPVTAEIYLHGELKNFPFNNSKNENFLIKAGVKNLELNYANNWPTAKNLAGNFLLDHQNILVTAYVGDVGGINIEKAAAKITIANQNGPILNLDLQAKNSSQNLLDFLQQSPLKSSLSNYQNYLNLKGDANLNLLMNMPLENVNKTTVNGQINLIDNNLLIAEKINLEHINGNLNFTEKKLCANNIAANLFTTPITIGVDYAQDAYIKAEGLFSFIKLKKYFALENLPIAGKTNAKINLFLNHDDNKTSSLTITSTLKGVTTNLPKPFKKEKSAVIKTKIHFNFTKNKTEPIQFYLDNGTHGNILKTNNNYVFNIKNKYIFGNILADFTAKDSFININLENFTLPDIKELQKNSAEIDLTKLPNFNINVKNLTYHNYNYGAVTVKTENKNNSFVVKDFRLENKLVTLQLNGLCKKEAKYTTTITGTLKTTNASKLLELYGIKSSIILSAALAKFSLTWPGKITSFDLHNTSGKIKISTKSGRIIDLTGDANDKLNFGRILSLLNINRIFKLNFSDLVNSGYGFDSLHAKIYLAKEKIFFNNFNFQGSVASIVGVGYTNLVNKQIKLDISVAPHVTASLPVLVTIFGGPVAGAVTWFLDKLARKSVNKAINYKYTVTGSWQKPIIHELNST